VSDQADQPLQVVKGEPTEDELAALVAVISAKAAEAEQEPKERPSNWAAYWRSVRRPLQPGPGAWRASANPHR
jgi:hypothetical protein